MFEHAPHFAVLALCKAELDPNIGASASLEVCIDASIAHTFDLDAMDQFLLEMKAKG